MHAKVIRVCILSYQVVLEENWKVGRHLACSTVLCLFLLLFICGLFGGFVFCFVCFGVGFFFFFFFFFLVHFIAL